jgi:hypothetical protein
VLDRVTPTTPGKEVAGAEHRIRYLSRAIRSEPKGKRATANMAELVRLQDVRDGWRGEMERNRAAWIAYHRRQRRILIELARRHRVALMKLTHGEEV